MKKLKSIAAALILTFILSFNLVGCSTASEWFGDLLGGGESATGMLEQSESASKAEESVTDVTENISTSTDVDSESLPDEYTSVSSSNINADKTNKLSTANTNYVLTGDIDLGSGKITVSATGITLYLYNVNITNSSSAEKVFNLQYDTTIVVVDGTTNSITSLGSKATVACDYNLTICGSGSLSITTSNKNAISVDGSLYIYDANINIDSANHGVSAESIVVSGATLDITSVKDGLHAEINYDELSSVNDIDVVSFDKGYVYLENSTITINATDDGIQADTFVQIVSGTINITANGGAPSTVTESSSGKASGKGIKVNSIDYTLESDTADSDGSKPSYTYSGDVAYTILIQGGTININSNDDAIHSNAYVVVTGGTIVISTGDDGMHSDEMMTISGDETSITISKCYEGIESAKIEISGGTISVTAVDDGINAADGTTNAVNVSNNNCYLLISGGTITVNAQGDGLDSNGVMQIDDGTIYVNGPASGSDNAALDSDGGIIVNGGNIIAVGSKQMVETPSSDSTQCVVSYSSNSTISAGTTISVKDSSGNVIISITTARSCQSIVFSSSSLVSGSTYYIYSGSTKLTSFTISSVITSIGSNGTTQNNGPSMQPGFNKR